MQNSGTHWKATANRAQGSSATAPRRRSTKVKVRANESHGDRFQPIPLLSEPFSPSTALSRASQILPELNQLRFRESSIFQALGCDDATSGRRMPSDAFVKNQAATRWTQAWNDYLEYAKEALVLQETCAWNEIANSLIILGRQMELDESLLRLPLLRGAQEDVADAEQWLRDLQWSIEGTRADFEPLAMKAKTKRP